MGKRVEPGDKVGNPSLKPPPLKRRQRHRTPHYAVLTLNLMIAMACFIGAVALVVGQNVLNNQRKTSEIVSPADNIRSPLSVPTESTDPATDGTGETSETVEATTTTEAFPIADPQARNFLITGSDNGACDDPGTVNPVGERDAIGERSDTIMIMRVDPSTSRAAVLSFPRDLWVKIAGTNKRSRINSAYSQNDPQKLVDTIFLNFGILVEHYIQIDFCAFKTLVDAVGGVSVPFEYPAQDRYTNLNVPTAGCYTFDGASALAYVRSRHYKYLDPKTNTYKEDPASDYGRISRQQDFLRRAVAKVVSQGVFDIDVARGLIDVAEKYVVTDPNLTLGKQLEFAGVLKNLDPNDIRTYQVEGVGTVVGGAAVIEPRLGGDNMKAILAIFSGQAQLETAPEQVFESTTSSVARTTTTTISETSTTVRRPSSGGTATTTKPASTTTTTTTTIPVTTSSLPLVAVEQDTRGIVPPKDVQC